jgi:outer membrane protein OmpA-like peptidoglycan-associated protein
MQGHLQRLDKYSAGCMMFAVLMSLMMFISGCATVKDTVVLVKDHDGKVGQVTVTTKGGASTLAVPNTMVEVTGPDSKPSDPAKIEQSRIDSMFAESMRAMPRDPVIFLLYFLHDSIELTADSKVQIPAILSAVKQRQFYEISLVGHTDTTGNEEHNMKLSIARAEAVRDSLLAQGIILGRIELRYHGKQDLIVQTGDNVSEPRNRVVEVVVK